MRTVTAQALVMTSRLGVLYDVTAAQQRVTSVFGGGGNILHNRETLLISGPILAMLRVTSLLRGGYTLHNLGAPFIIQL